MPNPKYPLFFEKQIEKIFSLIIFESYNKSTNVFLSLFNPIMPYFSSQFSFLKKIVSFKIHSIPELKLNNSELSFLSLLIILFIYNFALIKHLLLS